MKIFLVTMKGLPNDYVSQRMGYIAREAQWEAERLLAPPEMTMVDEASGPVPSETPSGPPAREHSWVSKDKDAIAIQVWREAVKARMGLLEKVGIIIQPSNPKNSESDDFEFRQMEYLMNPTFACTGEQLLTIMEHDSEIVVKSAAPVASDSNEGLLQRFEAVVKKMESIDIPDPSSPPDHIYNQHCEVHLPGNLLAHYNETLLLEDSCTDQLQGALNAGWRILAVCPQSQRRPDYILARFNPDIDVSGSALRRV